MNIYQSIAPLLIVVIYALHVKKRILVILGIPIIMSMQESAFIQTTGFSLKLPLLPFTFNWTILILFIVLSLAFSLLKNKRVINHSNTKTIRTLLYCYIVLVVMQVVVPLFLSGRGNFGIIISIITRVSFPIYVLVWIYIFRRLSNESADKLIKAIVFITVLQSVMYILSGIGIRIYPSSIYLETQFEETRIIRDFKTIPVYIFIALPILMLSSSIKDKYYLIIALMAVAMTYTRSVILAVGLSIVVYLTFFFDKMRFSKRLTLISVVSAYNIILIIIAFGGRLSTHYRYISDRFEQVNETGYEESSLGSRNNTFFYVIERNTVILNIFGNGFDLGTAGNRYEDARTSLTADSTWIQLLFYSGLFGVVLIMSVYLKILMRGFIKADRMKRSSLIKLGMFLSILYYVSLSFTSSVAISLPAAFSVAYISVHTGIE